MTGSARSLSARDAATIAPLTNMRFSPLEAECGRGSTLISPEGDAVLDLTGGLGAAGVGYAHPEVVEAISRAAREMPGIGVLTSTNPFSVGLAEDLLRAYRFDGSHQVYLGHAGSDANTAAIRAARAATGRQKVLTFSGSYHGGLGDAQALSGFYSDAGWPSDPNRIAVTFPDVYHPEAVTGDPGSDEAALLAATLDIVADALRAGDVGLIIVEPIANDAGVIVPPRGFLSGLRRLATERDVLLAVDEVKVGLGRTGTLMAASVEGVVPDILVLGKSLGGGLPVSAAILPAAVADAARGHLLLTTAGNPVAAAAGRAVVGLIERERLWEAAGARGQHMMAALGELAADHDIIGDVRGRGVTIGVELVRDRDSKRAAEGVAAAVVYRAHQLGVALGYCGPRGNVLELTPPLILTTSEAERGIGVIHQALSDVAAGRVDATEVAAYAGW